MKKMRYQVPLWLLPFCFVLVFSFACESKEKYAGLYKAEAEQMHKQAEIIFELKASGEGIWKVGGEEFSFSWYIKGAELRLNTKEGGVIVGKIEKDRIQITLPNMKQLSFKKMG
jgi:hypothetical protein